MLLNIAINTIITVMVFFFPGILSRWAFFSNFYRQASYQGAPVERIIYSLIWSLFNIAVLLWFFDFSVFDRINIRLDEKEFQDIVGLLKNLWEKEFPDILQSYEGFSKVLKYFTLLYIWSLMIGWVFQKTIKLFKLDYYFPSFRFKSEWIYLLTYTPKLAVKRSVFQKYNVRIDLLDADNRLFQGYFYNTIFSSDNNIDAIVLKNAIEFISLQNDKNEERIESIDKQGANSLYSIYKKDQYRTVYKKDIPGEILVIKNENIKNLNLLFVKDINSQFRRRKTLFYLIGYPLYLILLFLIPAVIWFVFNSSEILYFNTLVRRLTFSIITYLNVLLLCLYLIEKLIKEKQNLSFQMLLISISVLSIFYLWIFNILSITWTFVALVIMFFLLRLINSRKAK